MPERPERLPLFPDTTTIQDDSIHIGGLALTALAERYGTPLYVYDRHTMDEAVRLYRVALKRHYPGSASLTFAGKAFFCRAIAEWTGQQGLQVDCTAGAEVSMAAAGKLPSSAIIVHGVNKSAADLQAALHEAGTIVLDNLGEVKTAADLLRRPTQARDARPSPSLWLRLQPGISVDTHHPHTQTGHTLSKFGMTADELRQAADLMRSAGFTVSGLHFHQGSNFRDPAPLIEAIGHAILLAKELRLPAAWHFSPGGGWGVAYHEDELPQPDIEEYVRVIAHEVVRRCRLHGLSLPILHIEPGRSLVARAGVALYRVGAVKRRRQRTWLLVDGGMADNPRFALYGARYSCLPAHGLGREMTERVSIAGPYCEMGDVLIEDVMLPPMAEGELLAVPVSGAYQLSMSSNYNGARRPAAVWIDKGRSRLILRRETTEDLLRRQVSIL